MNNEVQFMRAQPVWAENRAHEMNMTILFRSQLKTACPSGTVLRLTGSSCYTVYINGCLFAMGPARCAHGFYRVDEQCLDAVLRGNDVVDIRVSGYNINSYEWLDMPAFLCAEICCGNQVLAATGHGGFSAYEYTERIQKAQKYSFQRTFAEIYDFSRRTDFGKPLSLTLQTEGIKAFLPRGIRYPDFEQLPYKDILRRGHYSLSEKTQYYADRAITGIGPKQKGYPFEQLEICSLHEAQKMDFDTSAEPAGTYTLYDMGCEYTGLIGCEVTCTERVRVMILFDEILTDGDVHFLRMGCSNVLLYDLPAGHHFLLSFEPYVLRYLKIAVSGPAESTVVSQVHMRRVGYMLPDVSLNSPDQNLQRIFSAALETFRQNTYDIYMDCPSRERAGWLCDSFFTGRVEYVLTGKSEVEHNFLQNFLLPDSFRFLPQGMLPMCYPSDHYDGIFIPNWAMWFVLELQEYLQRSGDRALIDAAKNKVYALLAYFQKFENEFGLLENLESWVFLEWSRANEFICNVNFPTNMLYARMKQVISALYDDPALSRQAAQLKSTIQEMSYSAEEDFFCDNACRTDGGLVRSGHHSECCQYYAFHTKVALPEQYPTLWKRLIEDFGPDRKATGKWPAVYPANAFIGNYLRLDLLSEAGLDEKVLENIIGYFLYMAETTGTLWENDGAYASCNHGFASHVLYWFDRMGLLKKGSL